MLLIFGTGYLHAEITLEAKKISYDSANEVITAERDVVVSQRNPGQKLERQLRTSKIEYNRKTGVIKLLGDSTLTERTGEVINGKDIVLDDNIKNGVIKALSVLLKDKAKIIAESAVKSGNIYSMANASYSPCYETKSCTLPLWDLCADKIEYDTEKKTFTYSNVRLRIKGMPIMYTPYFSHPSFDVKRKTGFVTPTISPNTNAGTLIGVPYFISVSDSKNLKITPFVNFKNRFIAACEYKESMKNSDLMASTSVVTKKDEEKNRWHIKTRYETYNLEKKRLSIEINRTSDVAYLLKYPIEGNNDNSIIKRKTNTSQVSAEFFDNNYFLENKIYSFQGTDEKTAPLYLPSIRFNHNTYEVMSGVLSFDSNNILVGRKDSEVYRTSNRINWNRDIATKHGLLFGLSSGCRFDLYSGEKHFFPLAENSISCKFPMRSEIGRSHSSIWWPKIELLSIRDTNNEYRTINEDSIFCNGIDEVENGEKVTYGIENSVYDNKSRRILNFFAGTDSRNVLGNITVSPNKFIKLRTKLVGTKSLEYGVNFDFQKVNIDCAYQNDNTTNEHRKFAINQATASIGYSLAKYWQVTYSNILDLSKEMKHINLLHRIFLKYADECFEFGIGIYKSKFEYMDYKPRTGIIFTVSFKNLGSSGKPAI